MNEAADRGEPYIPSTLDDAHPVSVPEDSDQVSVSYMSDTELPSVPGAAENIANTDTVNTVNPLCLNSSFGIESGEGIIGLGLEPPRDYQAFNHEDEDNGSVHDSDDPRNDALQGKLEASSAEKYEVDFDSRNPAANNVQTILAMLGKWSSTGNARSCLLKYAEAQGNIQGTNDALQEASFPRLMGDDEWAEVVVEASFSDTAYNRVYELSCVQPGIQRHLTWHLLKNTIRAQQRLPPQPRFHQAGDAPYIFAALMAWPAKKDEFKITTWWTTLQFTGSRVSNGTSRVVRLASSLRFAIPKKVGGDDYFSLKEVILDWLDKTGAPSCNPISALPLNSVEMDRIRTTLLATTKNPPVLPHSATSSFVPP